MPAMKFKDLKAMGTDKLNEKMAEIKKELMKVNTQIASKQNPDKPGRIKGYKKSIAQIKMIKQVRGEK
ncbi:50S ribosomal protein L29 [Candidatus Tiddalikarchaeum anstoanum]|nr:50S ribosomal protein L29 [Candidatus Tiddalikarchaeum anstoanum]